MANNSDGLLLMNYDEHQTGSGPGSIASQDRFLDNLREALKTIPKEKAIRAIGSYGYDWTTTIPDPPKRGAKPAEPKVLKVQEISTQDAWLAASDSDAEIQLDPASLNAHFAYDDDDAHVRHQ